VWVGVGVVVGAVRLGKVGRGVVLVWGDIGGLVEIFFVVTAILGVPAQ